MQKYVAPTMKCEQLTLFETIASNCWSGNNFYFDYDKDGQEDKWPICESLYELSNNCNQLKSFSILAQIQLFFFRCSPQEFEKWKVESKANDCDVLNNTGVSQIKFLSGTKPPKKWW